MKSKLLWTCVAVLIASALTGGILAVLESKTGAAPVDPVPVSESAAPFTQSLPTDKNTLPIVVDTPLDREVMQEYNKEQEALREKSRTAAGTPIGTYTTDLGVHNDANRVHNIKLALASLNKKVLLPGETFSFHGIIGDSTNGKLGYKPATVIIGKEFATDYGGGICQVSSTLYNAVARAKLQVTERYSHSLPVDYVPKGQDATVSFPDLDFKFVNSSASPIRIEASLQGSKVVCTILQIK